MTIKQQGGIFGRNPTFNNVDVEGDLATSGNVSGTLIGVGTSNPTEEVHILATLPTIQLEDSNNNYKARVYSNNGDVIIGSDVGNGNAGSAIRFEIDNSEVGRFTDAGNLKFSVAGNGIDFSATSGTGTSELFSDYEEGTWTPVMSENGAGVNNWTASTAIGYYTKIGRQVNLQCVYTYTAKAGNPAFFAFMIGIPFVPASDSGHFAVQIQSGSGAITDAFSGVASTGGDLRFVKNQNISSPGAMLGGDFPAATATITFQASYLT